MTRITKTGYIISETNKSSNSPKTPEDSNLLLSPYPYYQVISDADSCEACTHQNGTIIPATEAQVGKNVPPFHPNCRCMVIGCFKADKMDPFEQERNLWDYLLAEKLATEDVVRLFRNFYSISREEYTDKEILINYHVSILHTGDTQKIIQSFINRLNPQWIDPNLDKRFQFEWRGEHIDAKFRQKAADISDILGVSPDALMKVMASESRINPTAGNKYAIGLLQFTKPACEGMGTTREQLESMSAIEQLDWVYEYFRPNAGKFSNELDLYWNTFTNKAIGKNDYDVLFDKDLSPGHYDSNSNVDCDDDGKITRRDLAEHLERQLQDYWGYWAKR